MHRKKWRVAEVDINNMSTYSNTEKWSISAEWTFRGTAYTVCADVRDDVLVVQVEDKLAADRWSGQFDAKRKKCLCKKE